VEVFDVYTGEHLPQGKKSIALALVYRHAERTLTDEEVSERQALVVEALQAAFGASLRS
jgi:phenylalanyl-tRNA synthetase beta chain